MRARLGACKTGLRVNITIVYEHTVCATSAFTMCMLRVVFNVVLFCFLSDVASCRILFCLLLHNKVLKRVYMLFNFNLKDVPWPLIYPNSCIRLIICENVYFAVDDVA